MDIVFFAHPSFVAHQSMPRFAGMLADGMRARGHRVELWAPRPAFFRLGSGSMAQKWLSYIDQYLLFPWQVRGRLQQCAPDTLFVFTDHALGPWVPLVADRPHVIHCHDFLAQRSALGEIQENPTSWTGRRYQHFIRRGYTRGRRFISVSQKTQHDLHLFLTKRPAQSEVVYNGLNQDFTPQNPAAARHKLSSRIGVELAGGYLLHIGGNQWYKNRKGVIEIYEAWRARGQGNIPLLLIGQAPSPALKKAREASAVKNDIHFLSGLDDECVRLAYAGADLFLFPSFAEGFGWPIAEAMASGCPVVTTNEAPMSEVAGQAGFLIPRRPAERAAVVAWAKQAAGVVDQVLALSATERQNVIQAGLRNAQRFNAAHALDQIESIYQGILQEPNAARAVQTHSLVRTENPAFGRVQVCENL